MRFDLRNFLESAKTPYTTHISVDLSQSDFDGFTVPEPAKVSFEATPTMEGVSMTLQINAEVATECARCLTPIRETYEFTREYLVRQRDLEDPDMELPLEADGCLNVEELVYQEMIFQVPRVLLCSPDCPGLCPICGKSKKAGCTCRSAEEPAPVDARLSILKQLLS